MDAEQVRARINSKKAHIHYLENRIHDHTPVLAEITRREEEIKKHQDAIASLRSMLADIPGRLEQARRELKEFENRLRTLNGRSDMTADNLRERILTLQAMIEALKTQKGTNGT